MALRAISSRPIITTVSILAFRAGRESALPRNLLMASMAQMTAGINACQPVGSIVLPMILAAVLVSELLLSALLILLRDCPSFHLLPGFQGLSFHMLLPGYLLLGGPLLVLLFLILHKLLEYMGLLQLMGGYLLLRGQVAQARIAIAILLVARVSCSARSAMISLPASSCLLRLH